MLYSKKQYFILSSALFTLRARAKSKKMAITNRDNIVNEMVNLVMHELT